MHGLLIAFGGAFVGARGLAYGAAGVKLAHAKPRPGLTHFIASMASPKKPASAPHPSFADLISVVASPERWRIYTELAKGEPLPVGEIARRVGLTPNGASKLLLRLERSGLLERRYGRVYRIPPKFLVQGEAKLDFGPIVARLDYQDKESA